MTLMSYYLGFSNLTLATRYGVSGGGDHGSKQVEQVGSNLGCSERRGCCLTLRHQ